MVKKIRIHKHEVGLWFRHGDFRDVLAAGRHWFFGFLRNRVEVYDAAVAKFDHPKLEVLVAEPALAAKLTVVELTDTQRALVWKDRRLGWILGPGRHAFWKEPAKIEVEVFDVSDFKLEHPKIDVILGHPGGVRFFEGVRVEAHERVLLFREGELVEQLGPGIHVFWKHAGKITWKAMDLREQATDVAGQEIMTADKVTLRVNLLVTHQVVDVVKAVAVVADAAQALYREAQLALRAAVGIRPLDRLLADKEAVGAEVRDVVSKRARGFGVEVRAVGLRDIILPGDMKSILNQVIEAQKQAEANLVRRREETAAARSQVNTAKLMADHPALARMKELEALQDILEGAKLTFVLGGGDLTDQVRQMVAKDIGTG